MRAASRCPERREGGRRGVLHRLHPARKVSVVPTLPARALTPWLLAALLAPAAAAQQGQFGQPGQGLPQEPTVPGLQDPLAPLPTQPHNPFGYDAFNRPFQPFESGVGQVQGFPTFPPGIYPPPPKNWMQPPSADRIAAQAPRALPLLPTNPDWPSWLKLRLERELPYAPDQAVLVRDADRVWLRPPDEDAFVPLYFFDKLRPLAVGTAIEVRQVGAFQIVFHGGSRLVARGPTSLRLLQLDAEQMAFELLAFTSLELSSTGRACRLQLPDGSELLLPAAEPAAGRADLRLDRADEPGWYGGRAELLNAGARPLSWRTAAGDLPLPPGYRARMLLQPSPEPIGAALQHRACSLQRTGPMLQVEPTGADASVSWMGARLSLPPGSRLSLDPLLGEPFAPEPPGGR